MKVKQYSKQTIVLASGGIDSTGLIDFYLRRGCAVKAVFFDYGQPSLEAEQRALRGIVERYSIEHRIIKLGFSPAERLSEYSSRNALFLFAASSLGFDPVKIAMGIRAHSSYFDCSPLFVNECQDVLDGYFAGCVRFEAPFLSFTKKQVIQYCRKYRVPLQLTFSCTKSSVACGKCLSCIERNRYLRGL